MTDAQWVRKLVYRITWDDVCAYTNVGSITKGDIFNHKTRHMYKKLTANQPPDTSVWLTFVSYMSYGKIRQSTSRQNSTNLGSLSLL